jgi:alcohol dehydrogenase class IV
MSNALGALAGYDLHHGTLNAVLLPHVLAQRARRRGALRAMRQAPASPTAAISPTACAASASG